MFDKNLQPFKGSHPLSTFKDEIENFFDRFSKELSLSGDSGFMPKVEVKDNGNNFLVCAELPGMTENDINLSLDNNTLIIEGERKNESKKEEKGYFQSEFSYGSFYRAIPLSADIKEDTVKADYENGVLRVTLEKAKVVEPKAKKIAISSSKSQTKH